MDLKNLYSSCIFILAVFLLSGCGETESLRMIQQPPLADKLYYGKLLEQVKSQIGQAPDNVDLRIKLAGYHQSLGWPDESDENMASLLRLAPQEPHVMVLAADYYISNGDFEKSWIYAQQADKLGSVHPSLSLIQAKYYLSRRNYKEASRFIEHYYQVGGDLPEAYEVGAELAKQAGDILKATSILLKGVDSNPGNTKLVAGLTAIYVAQGEMEGAVNLMENYQQITGDRSTFRNELLGAYFSLRSYERASRLAENWPVQEESGKFQYGQLFLESYMTDSANYYANQILEADSASTNGLLLKARYFHKRGRLGDSYNYYTSLLMLDDDNQIALRERGIVRGKIAYLRKLEEEKASIPAFDLTPKKTDNQ